MKLLVYNSGLDFRSSPESEVLYYNLKLFPSFVSNKPEKVYLIQH